MQIGAHIQRLRQPDVYDQGPGSKGMPMNGMPAGPPNPDDDSACAVCGIIRLTFEPPAVYCTSCAQRIKRNQVGPMELGLGCGVSGCWRELEGCSWLQQWSSHGREYAWVVGIRQAALW